jgi:hypothetical protein
LLRWRGRCANQECGGVSGCPSAQPNSIGRFGFGGSTCTNTGYGAGGGGWYGGGSFFSGGGGSGYISPFATSGSFPGGTNAGNGKVIITTTT